METTTQKILAVLSAIGIVCWGAAVFVGVHFASGGSWPVSLSVGLACVLLMGLFFFLSCRFAQPRRASEYGRSVVVKKWVFISIYWALSVASAVYVLHAVNCTTVLKERIRSQAAEEFKALQTMVSKDGSEQGSYKGYVDGILANYRNANPNHLTDADKLDMELTDLSDQYLVRSQYPALRSRIADFWEPASYAVEHWDIFTVGYYLGELDSKKLQWDRELTACSQAPLQSQFDLAGIHADYEPLPPTYTTLGEPLRHPASGPVSPLAWLLALALQALIMISWIVVCRSRYKAPVGTASSSRLKTW